MQLKVSDAIESRVNAGEISGEDAAAFSTFVDTCNRELMTHPVITDNAYCKWFASGAADREDVKHFIVQFSVFSNLFLIAQLLKTINAGSLEGMRASKEILANEIGVIFHKPGAKKAEVEDHDVVFVDGLIRTGARGGGQVLGRDGDREHERPGRAASEQIGKDLREGDAGQRGGGEHRRAD